MIQLKKGKKFEAEKFNKNFLLTIKDVKEDNERELTSKDKDGYKLVVSDEESKQLDTKLSNKTKSKITLKVPKGYKHQLNKKAPVLKVEKIRKYKKTELIKLGFKKYKDKTRVIINTKSPLKYEIDTEGKKFKITLKNCKLGQRIARLTLDTSYFGSVVKKIRPKIQSSNEIIVEITLDKNIDLPIFTQNENNIYIDFKEE